MSLLHTNAPAPAPISPRSEPVNLYDTLAERERIARAIAAAEREYRIMRWQRGIGIACYVIAVFTACWFAFQLGRGAF